MALTDTKKEAASPPAPPSSSSPATQEQIRNSILERLRAEKERLSTMPPSSKYVLHRSRVINRAEQLLVSVEDEAELMALLEKLAI